MRRNFPIPTFMLNSNICVHLSDSDCAWRSDRRTESVKKYRSRRGEGGREAGCEAGEAEGGEQVRVQEGEAHEATSCAKIPRDGTTERGAMREEGESKTKSAI